MKEKSEKPASAKIGSSEFISVVTFEPFVEEEDVVPDERERPNAIPLVPQVTYIRNAPHFKKYKIRGKKKAETFTSYDTSWKIPTESKG